MLFGPSARQGWFCSQSEQQDIYRSRAVCPSLPTPFPLPLPAPPPSPPFPLSLPSYQVVATLAFGMGLDKADVGAVSALHLLPGTPRARSAQRARTLACSSGSSDVSWHITMFWVQVLQYAITLLYHACSAMS